MNLHASRARGFTLLELMMVVVIIALLSAIALPAYTQQVVRSNRAEAMTELLRVAQEMERCFSRFGVYNRMPSHSHSVDYCWPARALGIDDGIPTSSGNYRIALSGLTATTFTLIATPEGSQASRDKRCGAFTLTQAGARGIVEVGGVTGTVQDCWR